MLCTHSLSLPPDRTVRTGTAVVTKPYNTDKRTESWRVKQHCQHIMTGLGFLKKATYCLLLISLLWCFHGITHMMTKCTQVFQIAKSKQTHPQPSSTSGTVKSVVCAKEKWQVRNHESYSGSEATSGGCHHCL